MFNEVVLIHYISNSDTMIIKNNFTKIRETVINPSIGLYVIINIYNIISISKVFFEKTIDK